MMNLVELLEEDGIEPKKVSQREYCSPCPVCAGTDRFRTWPGEGDSGRGWCRQCELSVDGIGYLMECRGMSYPDAAKYIGRVVRPSRAVRPTSVSCRSISETPTQDAISWGKTAGRFIVWAADNLQKNGCQLGILERERGISKMTAHRWQLGWNPTTLRVSGKEWGLEGTLTIPAGLVIPNIRNGQVVSVKIRTVSGKPKYQLLKGSKVYPYQLTGDIRGTVVIVESELDTLLLWDTARDLCSVIAAGGCSNRPDNDTMDFLFRAGLLLNCLDNDQAGEAAGAWYHDWFP